MGTDSPAKSFLRKEYQMKTRFTKCISLLLGVTMLLSGIPLASGVLTKVSAVADSDTSTTVKAVEASTKEAWREEPKTEPPKTEPIWTEETTRAPVWEEPKTVPVKTEPIWTEETTRAPVWEEPKTEPPKTDSPWTEEAIEASEAPAPWEEPEPWEEPTSRILSVTAKQVKPLIKDADLVKDEFEDYASYNINSAFEFTVTFTDGTPAVTGSLYEVNEKTGFWAYISGAYDSGEWDVGDHEVSLEIEGESFPFTVTISESPIAAISVSNERTVDAKKDGVTQLIKNEFIQIDEDHYEDIREYGWGYHEGSIAFDFTVRYKSGEVKTYRYYHCGVFDGCPVKSEDYHNGDWTKDHGIFMLDKDHKLQFSYMGCPFEVTIPVINEDSFDYIEQNGELYITDYYGGATELTIPATLNGKPVAGVLDLSRKKDCDHSLVKKLTIQDGVRNVSADALHRLPNLETAVFGALVKGLNADCFAGLRKLNSFTVSSKNPDYTVIDGAIYDKAITTLVAYPEVKAETSTYAVPDTVSDIDAYLYSDFAGDFTVGDANKAFTKKDGVLYTKDMTKVIRCDTDKSGEYRMPDTVTTIAASAFANCKALTKVAVSDKVTEIVYYTFANCEALKEVDLPVSVKKIGKDAFYSEVETEWDYKDEGPVRNITRHSAMEIIGLNAVEEIGDRAFYGTTLKSADLRAAQRIGDEAFMDALIENVQFSNQLSFIGASAFAWTNITAAALPDSLTALGKKAFYMCGKLATVSFGNGITEIPKECFFGCKKLNKLTLPANVQRVGENAFMDASITDLKIENPDIKLEGGYWNPNPFSPLNEATIGKGLRILGTNADRNPKTNEITYPDGITEIVYREFSNMEATSYTEKLTIRSIPTSVKHISMECFNDITLTDKENGAVYIGDALIRQTNDEERSQIHVRKGTRIIADDAFEANNAIGVSLPEGLEIIGDYAFYRSKLQSVEIPKSVTTIGAYAFCNTNLKEITIPASVTKIGDSAFSGSGVEKMTVDAKNTAYTMQDGILYTKDMKTVVYCLASTKGEIKLPNTVTSIRPGAFFFCDGITAIYLPAKAVINGPAFGKKIVYSEYGMRFEPIACPTVFLEKNSPAEAYMHTACLPYDFYESGVLFVQSGDSVAVTDNGVRLQKNTAAGDLMALTNASYLADKDGKQLSTDAVIGTGMKLVVTVDGKIKDELALIVPGDVDGDADITAADARLALRRAVNLEDYAEDSVWYLACDVDDAETVSAADARMILRAAVGLENPDDWIA